MIHVDVKLLFCCSLDEFNERSWWNLTCFCEVGSIRFSIQESLSISFQHIRIYMIDGQTQSYLTWLITLFHNCHQFTGHHHHCCWSWTGAKKLMHFWSTTDGGRYVLFCFKGLFLFVIVYLSFFLNV